MPIQHYTGSNNFDEMACHVYALSGDHNNIANINARYAQLGEYLLGRAALPAADATVPNGLNTATAGDIRAAVAAGNMQEGILELLCIEFGIALNNGSGIRIWGHFEEGQMLPEHMYVTHTDGNIYDTMPNVPVRRDVNNNGLNPPSYGAGNLLAQNVVFSVEVAALAAGTMIPINAPNTDWANGMG